ncbi:cytochrome C [Methylovorus sp. MM2]|uniref:c-type cytochrome n=1 Tax=Methylovorus sp. MM2 TaxID=1848038 RepID=UPI0007E0EA1B|nr:c-type cytochrome [Methylovorus sp. MM2]OAM51741.1 cytochrome C [Methylovorus sp. MM2]
MSFRNIAVLVLSLGVLASVSIAQADDVAPIPLPAAAAVCAACHGADGNSMIPVYPKLAGQHPEYLAKQLSNIKSGVRMSPIMAGMAAPLKPEDITAIVAYFGAQTMRAGTSASNGAGSVGEKIFKGGIPGVGVPACTSCHGASGQGLAPEFPRLAGQHAGYITAQLQLFNSGARANDAAKMMRMIASKMTPEDMAAVADYIQGMQ